MDAPEELVRTEEDNKGLEEEGFVKISGVDGVDLGEVALENGPTNEHMVAHVQEKDRNDVGDQGYS